jgi:signal transduction histidine kinase
LAASDSPRSKALADEVGHIEAATNQLAGMIAELSDVARIQIGRSLVLRKARTDIVALVQETVQELKRTTKRQRFRLEVPSTALVGDWDPVRVKRVLTNLLSNAIKYSPRGGEIAVTIEEWAPNGSKHARITVSDQGIGIGAADLPHVFERYYRGKNVGIEMTGAGIGLAGVKQIIEQHGGSIEIQSVEGQGTTVTVLLPLGVASGG